jgi:hypothetical protein
LSATASEHADYDWSNCLFNEIRLRCDEHIQRYAGPKNAVFWKVFMAATMMNAFWDITSCGCIKIRRFRVKYILPKHRFLLEPHGVISQKTFLIYTVMLCLDTLMTGYIVFWIRHFYWKKRNQKYAVQISVLSRRDENEERNFKYF